MGQRWGGRESGWEWDGGGWAGLGWNASTCAAVVASADLSRSVCGMASVCASSPGLICLPDSCGMGRAIDLSSLPGFNNPLLTTDYFLVIT